MFNESSMVKGKKNQFIWRTRKSKKPRKKSNPDFFVSIVLCLLLLFLSKNFYKLYLLKNQYKESQCTKAKNDKMSNLGIFMCAIPFLVKDKAEYSSGWDLQGSAPSTLCIPGVSSKQHCSAKKQVQLILISFSIFSFFPFISFRHFP